MAWCLTSGNLALFEVVPRPIDDPAIANAPGADGCDIGAFELGGIPVQVESAAQTSPAAPGLTVAGPYPNPSSTYARVQVRPSAAGSLNIAIFDLTGRRIVTVLDRIVPGDVKLDISFSTTGLASGVYLIRSTDGRASNVRLISVVH